MKDMEIQSVIKSVLSQVSHADERYGPFKSSHEGFGVLAEEVVELLDSIRENDIVGIKIEAIQVSATALRIAVCCEDEEFQKRSVK
jgi:hypothetical protein